MSYAGPRYDRRFDTYSGDRPISKRVPWIDTDTRVSYRRNQKMSKSKPTPATSSWLDGSCKSGPSRKDFRNLQSTTISPATRSLDLKPEQAFALVNQALKGHRRTKLLCLKSNLTNQEHRIFTQTMPFQVFNELDKEFFRSTLSGNISLGWSDLPDGIFSRTVHAGQNGNPRIRIELSTQLSWHRAPKHILAALIHQMVHAYYLQCCGYRDRSSRGDGHDLSHERSFWALLGCIGEHLEPLQDILKEDLEVVSQNVHDKSQREHGCRCRLSSKKPTPGGSLCYGEKNRCNDDDIREWRDIANAVAKSLHEVQTIKSIDSSKHYR